MKKKAPARPRSVGTKVTQEEFDRLQGCADAKRLSLSEWCREVLLAASARPFPTEQAILGEVIALRTIVANLIYAFTSEGKVSKEQMRAFVERADQTKLKRANELLSQLLPEDRPGVTKQQERAGEAL